MAPATDAHSKLNCLMLVAWTVMRGAGGAANARTGHTQTSARAAVFTMIPCHVVVGGNASWAAGRAVPVWAQASM